MIFNNSVKTTALLRLAVLQSALAGTALANTSFPKLRFTAPEVNGCIGLENPTAPQDGDRLTLVACSEDRDDIEWLVDPTTGTVHSQTDTNYCWTVFRGLPPSDGSPRRLRLYECSAKPGIAALTQHFDLTDFMDNNGDVALGTIRYGGHRCIVRGGSGEEKSIVMQECDDTMPLERWNAALQDADDSTTTATNEVAPATDVPEEATNNDEATNNNDRRPNIIVMQPDDFPFFTEWTPPPKNPRAGVRVMNMNMNMNFNMNNNQRRTATTPMQGFRPPNHNRQRRRRAQRGGAFAENFPNGYEMPYLEQLRTEGLQMMQAYAASSMCATSRFSTITGRYPSRSGFSRENNSNNTISNVQVTNTKLHDMEGQANDCSEDNIAAVLKGHGYRTGVVGKWHLSDFDPRTYTYENTQSQIRECGFDYADGIYVENLGFSGGAFSHNQEWVTEKAIEFMNEDDDTPFFLYFNPTVPHPSGRVALALQNFTCRDTPSGVLDEDVLNVPRMTEGYSSCSEYRETIFERAGQSGTNHDLGAVWVDDSVGALLQVLEDKQQLDNTIFLFQIDHGVEAKGTHWENGNRIAQFVHYPNEFGTSGTRMSIPVSTIDIVPTLLDYAGVPSTDRYEMDGISWSGYPRYPSNGGDEQQNENGPDVSSRCMMFELEQDRSLVCGRCHKLMSLVNPNAGRTYEGGVAFGFAVDSAEMYFNLCDNGGEHYVSFPSNSTEAENTALEHLSTFDSMREVLRCLTNHTSPRNPPDYDTTPCDIFLA